MDRLTVELSLCGLYIHRHCCGLSEVEVSSREKTNESQEMQDRIPK